MTRQKQNIVTSLGPNQAEKYKGLYDAVAEGDSANAGRRIVLLPSIYGFPRFYNECFQNSMIVVQHIGKPSYFITITTNPNWDEIKNSLHPTEEPKDRSDICGGVFKIKYSSLIDDILKQNILGKVVAHYSTTEWQKRGLTHSHILLIMTEDSKPKTADAIDQVFYCEIHDKVTNPILHKIIPSCNIHDSCGQANMMSSCMEGLGQQRYCSKGYPKAFRQATFVAENSFPEYRRRDRQYGGHTHTIQLGGQEFTVDNRWNVPYNPFLSLRYQCHISCEVVHSVKAVKYLYKYQTRSLSLLRMIKVIVSMPKMRLKLILMHSTY
ncbi:Hypothetical predicted protein [Octopus vulgaris]|uniref:Helitron helicase-like domain-containing protein n=1 Tax=Octopus vulgaris TaxID=6645 RepID=A0AA36ALP1_OCTVU|nr:Hypothetical predicted protein [Octopus vulgaris]